MSQPMEGAPLASFMAESQCLYQCLVHRIAHPLPVVRQRIVAIVRLAENLPDRVEDHIPPHPAKRPTGIQIAVFDHIPKWQVHGLDAVDSQSEIHNRIEKKTFTTDGSTEYRPQALIQLLVRIDLGQFREPSTHRVNVSDNGRWASCNKVVNSRTKKIVLFFKGNNWPVKEKG